MKSSTDILTRLRSRKVVLGFLGIIAVVAAVLLSYALGMRHGARSDEFDEIDTQVRSSIEQYIDAINSHDLPRIEALSTGLAEEQLNPSFKGGYVRDMAWWITKHGQMRIESFDILARGDKVYVVEVYTKFADQDKEAYYYPGARVRYSMFRLSGQWKVMGVDRYTDYDS